MKCGWWCLPLLQRGAARLRPPALTWWCQARAPLQRSLLTSHSTLMFLLHLQGLAERPPPPGRFPRRLSSGTDASFSSCKGPGLTTSEQPGPQAPERSGTSAQPSPPPRPHLISFPQGMQSRGQELGRGGAVGGGGDAEACPGGHLVWQVGRASEEAAVRVPAQPFLLILLAKVKCRVSSQLCCCLTECFAQAPKASAPPVSHP